MGEETSEGTPNYNHYGHPRSGALIWPQIDLRIIEIAQKLAINCQKMVSQSPHNYPKVAPKIALLLPPNGFIMVPKLFQNGLIITSRIASTKSSKIYQNGFFPQLKKRNIGHFPTLQFFFFCFEVFSSA